MDKLSSEFEIKCPCCESTLVVDSALGRVLSHREPERADKPKLDQAHRILASEKARRETLFSESVAREKGRSDVLAKRFDEALKQAKKEPIEKPLRDFDLD
jgi:hypothetical protein